MTPSELAVAVKETLLNKPGKGQVFKAFANAMGDDFIKFTKHCNDAIEAVKAKQIFELEKKLAELKK